VRGVSPAAQGTAIAAALREQAHIDRRAPVTIIPQFFKADRLGKRRPDILRVAA
jgi:hypothetical protein